ncbi:VacJ family lipoprotein [Fodinicurvata sp. EGI_FJ10296]|uniref:MlaA family lipoprotein n=1 Tax=Fodinicurvata sp. EGI_FJ10296 TaxID=3231908 RepID=UPI003452179A
MRPARTNRCAAISDTPSGTVRLPVSAALFALAILVAPAAAAQTPASPPMFEDSTAPAASNDSAVTGPAMAGRMDGEIYDPLEPINRGVFAFNEAVDIVIVVPTATVYETVIPLPLRNNLRSFLRNLRTPVTLANNLLQGDWSAAETTATRFFINSTLGLGGFTDVATSAGHPYESADFGQTMGRWGVGPGPYAVRPFLGPTNLRDTVGWVVDTVSDPVSIVLMNEGAQAWNTARTGVGAVDARSRVLDEVQELRESSVDTYATVRSLTQQMRERKIRGDGMDSNAPMPTFEDFEDFGDGNGISEAAPSEGETAAAAPPSSLSGRADGSLLDGQQATLPSSHWLADTD